MDRDANRTRQSNPTAAGILVHPDRRTRAEAPRPIRRRSHRAPSPEKPIEPETRRNPRASGPENARGGAQTDSPPAPSSTLAGKANRTRMPRESSQIRVSSQRTDRCRRGWMRPRERFADRSRRAHTLRCGGSLHTNRSCFVGAESSLEQPIGRNPDRTQRPQESLRIRGPTRHNAAMAGVGPDPRRHCGPAEPTPRAAFGPCEPMAHAPSTESAPRPGSTNGCQSNPKAAGILTIRIAGARGHGPPPARISPLTHDPDFAQDKQKLFYDKVRRICRLYPVLPMAGSDPKPPVQRAVRRLAQRISTTSVDASLPRPPRPVPWPQSARRAGPR
jgi:hypothetical protein